MALRYLLLTILSCLSLGVNSYLEYDGWLNIELQHAIDGKQPDKFTPRGNVTIPSLNVGIATVVQEPLTTEERNNLKKLADDNQFYRLRAVAIYADGTKSTFLTSSKACALSNSQLNDIIWVSIDSTGSVLAITQTVTGIGNCRDVRISADDLENFNTEFVVKHMELAPVPDTTSYIQKMEREREARERGDVRDNRGFFAKYWMYLVPVALLVLLSGATTPDTSGGR